MQKRLETLLNSPVSYVAYNAALLLNSETGSSLKRRMEHDARVLALIAELQDWPGPQISSHKSAHQFFHKLAFLADIGIDTQTEGIQEIAHKILSIVDKDLIPCLYAIVHHAAGDSGSLERAWALCDAPSTLYALTKMGIKDERIDAAVSKLAEKIEAFGYGCHVSASLGNWRGPGKKDEPCPYATLIMLKLLNLYPDRFNEGITICCDSLLNVWEHSQTKHPYMFYMGTDFRKLKVPYIWYDIMHVVEVLSQAEKYQDDRRLNEMYEIIKKKETEHGFIPESVYMPWKEWDFGQKKTVSDWLTLCILKIERRLTPVLT